MSAQPPCETLASPGTHAALSEGVRMNIETHGRHDPLRAISIAAQDFQLWEDMRKATENRILSLEQANQEVPQSRYSSLTEIQEGEKRARKRLQEAVADSPWQAFVDDHWGVGAKSLGLLLGEIGNPAWHAAEDRPRTVSELWAYCGHGDAARRRQKGQSRVEASLAGKTAAKTAARLCVAPQVKWVAKQSPYREIYDAVKLDAAERHPDWTKKHVNNHGLRLATKEFLQDLYDFGKAVVRFQGPPAPQVYTLREEDPECPYWGLYARCTRLASHTDHKIPRAQGGTDEDDNLQLICGACNTFKNDRTDGEFRAALHLISENQLSGEQRPEDFAETIPKARPILAPSSQFVQGTTLE